MTITRQQQARIRRGAQRGETLAETAAAVGLTRAGVRYWLCRWGLTVARAWVNGAALRARILALHEAGLTAAQIARHKTIRRSASTVRRHLARARTGGE